MSRVNGQNVTRGLHAALDVEELTSGPKFNARTVSLCSQSFTDAVKSTHRIGTFSFCANLTQTARVSGSAFVLSRNLSLHVVVSGVLGVRMYVPTTTRVPSSMRAVAALIHFSRCFNMLLNERRSSTAAMQV